MSGEVKDWRAVAKVLMWILIIFALANHTIRALASQTYMPETTLPTWFHDIGSSFIHAFNDARRALGGKVAELARLCRGSEAYHYCERSTHYIRLVLGLH